MNYNSDDLSKLYGQISDLKSEIEDIKIALHHQGNQNHYQRNHNSQTFSNSARSNAVLEKIGSLSTQFLANDNNMNRTILATFSQMAKHYTKNSFSFIGQRAFGGNVSKSGSYLIGERGPEIFSPNQSGVITNLPAKSNKINVNLNITSPDIKNFYKSKDKIINELIKEIKRANL
jgi:hypothetical protein